MRCPNCDSEEAKEILTTTVFKDHQGSLLVIDKVPLISCASCGESFYSPEAIKKMDHVRKHPEQASEKMVKFFELGAA